MKSITRLSLALIIFSLFSTSYLVTSAFGEDVIEGTSCDQLNRRGPYTDAMRKCDERDMQGNVAKEERVVRDVNASGCNRDESGLCIAHDIPPMRDGKAGDCNRDESGLCIAHDIPMMIDEIPMRDEMPMRDDMPIRRQAGPIQNTSPAPNGFIKRQIYTDRVETVSIPIYLPKCTASSKERGVHCIQECQQVIIGISNEELRSRMLENEILSSTGEPVCEPTAWQSVYRTEMRDTTKEERAAMPGGRAGMTTGRGWYAWEKDMTWSRTQHKGIQLSK